MSIGSRLLFIFVGLIFLAIGYFQYDARFGRVERERGTLIERGESGGTATKPARKFVALRTADTPYAQLYSSDLYDKVGPDIEQNPIEVTAEINVDKDDRVVAVSTKQWRIDLRENPIWAYLCAVVGLIFLVPSILPLGLLKRRRRRKKAARFRSRKKRS